MKIMTEKLYINMRQGKNMLGATFISAISLLTLSTLSNPASGFDGETRAFVCEMPDVSTDSLNHVEGKPLALVPNLTKSSSFYTAKPILFLSCRGGGSVGKVLDKKSL